jgi:hypothetical protein
VVTQRMLILWYSTSEVKGVTHATQTHSNNQPTMPNRSQLSRFYQCPSSTCLRSIVGTMIDQEASHPASNGAALCIVARSLFWLLPINCSQPIRHLRQTTIHQQIMQLLRLPNTSSHWFLHQYIHRSISIIRTTVGCFISFPSLFNQRTSNLIMGRVGGAHNCPIDAFTDGIFEEVVE